MRFWGTLLLFVLPLSSFAQISSDSVWQVWQDEEQPDSLRIEALYRVCMDLYYHGEYDSARVHMGTQRDLATSLGYSSLAARATYNLGWIAFQLDSLEQAEPLFSEAIALQEQIGDSINLIYSLKDYGVLKAYQGDYYNALKHFEQGLSIAQGINDLQEEASYLNNKGVIYSELSMFEEALETYLQCLEVKKAYDESSQEPTIYSNIGTLYFKTGDFVRALEYHQYSLSLNEEIQDQEGIAFTLCNLGETYFQLGRIVDGISTMERGLALAQEIDYLFATAYANMLLSRVYLSQKNWKEAINFATVALREARVLTEAEGVRDASEVLYKAYKAQGNNSDALAMYEVYVEMRDSLDNADVQKQVIRDTYEEQALLDSLHNAQTLALNEARLGEELKRREFQTYAWGTGLLLSMTFGFFLFQRLQVFRSQRNIIRTQKQEVDKAYASLEQRNREVLDSIGYAKRIQRAFLPTENRMLALLPKSFVFYQPKAIVAGDFYWVEKVGNKTLVAVADCTGHGVPGAMVSVICHNALTRAVQEKGLTIPGEILDYAREVVVHEFEASSENITDGMDIALITLEGHELHYAGAYCPLWVVRATEEESAELEGATTQQIQRMDNHVLLEVKANKQPIGKFPTSTPYQTHTIALQANDTIYLFSDGYTDQFGGEHGKKFMTGRLKSLLLTIQENSLEDQQKRVAEAYENWRGEEEQVDDVCLIGIRV